MAYNLRFAVRCTYNPKLRCPIKRSTCPLQDARFIKALERFLYTKRDPRSPDLAGSKNFSNTHDFFLLDYSGFQDLPYRVKQIICLASEVVFEFPEFDRTGKINMTDKKCREWRSVRAKWKKFMDYPKHGNR